MVLLMRLAEKEDKDLAGDHATNWQMLGRPALEVAAAKEPELGLAAADYIFHICAAHSPQSDQSS